MEGSGNHCVAKTEGAQAPFQLCSSLSGEGDDDGVHRIRRPLQASASDAASEHGRLARSCAGDDCEQRSVCHHCTLLVGIEIASQLADDSRGPPGSISVFGGVCDHRDIVGVCLSSGTRDGRSSVAFAPAGIVADVSAPGSFWNPAFPEKHLFDGESVTVDLKPHWWYFAKPVGSVAAAAAVLAVVSQWGIGGATATWGALFVAVVLIVCLIWLGVRWLKWRSTHFVVTSDRVVYRSGVFIKRGIAIPLERVNNINFHQTLFERMIGSGDLQIESAGQDGQQLFFDIRRPDGVQNVIHAQIEENERRGMSGSGVALDIASQLERLEGLRDRGTLTDEEFTKQKNRLLAGE